MPGVNFISPVRDYEFGHSIAEQREDIELGIEKKISRMTTFAYCSALFIIFMAIITHLPRNPICP
jgi:hypothetical protein